MNKEQKIIASIFAPIIITIVTGICFFILGSIAAWIRGIHVSSKIDGLFALNEDTWFFWTVVVVLTGIVEMGIWNNKN